MRGGLVLSAADSKAKVRSRAFHRVDAGAWTREAPGDGGWRWIDLAAPSAAEVGEALCGLGLEAADSGRAFDPVAEPDDACGRLDWGLWGFHLVVALWGAEHPHPGRTLHVIAAPGTIVTVHDGSWPGLGRLLHSLRRGDAHSRSLRDELSENTAAVAARLVEPVTDALAAAARRAVDRAEALSRRTIEQPGRTRLWSDILDQRRDLLSLRRRYAPLSRAVGAVPELPTVSKDAQARFRDLGDRVSDSLDTLDMLREGLSSTAEAFASIQSNEINKVMKVLTLVSVLFLPATLIASIYGMNFAIPEIHWPGGYWFSLVLMMAVTGSLLAFLRGHGWL